jgi:hypothetical protein
MAANIGRVVGRITRSSPCDETFHMNDVIQHPLQSLNTVVQCLFYSANSHIPQKPKYCLYLNTPTSLLSSECTIFPEKLTKCSKSSVRHYTPYHSTVHIYKLALLACARVIYKIPLQDMHVLRLPVPACLERSVSEEMWIVVLVHANGMRKVLAHTTPQAQQGQAVDVLLRMLQVRARKKLFVDLRFRMLVLKSRWRSSFGMEQRSKVGTLCATTLPRKEWCTLDFSSLP